ncbi:hypothetical protein NCS57_00671200 [Fusarium keratoplasticum]|uniref:Uncharacterized protein n=1 Tax=Fusarium keratoplasticum TaxID=1328300 RepID=A0ACC0QUS8_9HYPO|nr:hypothetical protein NCS57_00671200 [Fusarium keratoplasticum]KAI8668595.1 hypothetical protein NCS57_00671200 [Fusarium keratoplasticum]KAI8673218.1 hypothetical protein NCS55_00641000 [Fusarium keratoplasticum]
MGEVPASFFSHHLGQRVRLLFIGGDGSRAVPGSDNLQYGVAQPGQRVRFADAAPFLLTSSSSEGEARSRLPPNFQAEDIILRLRPNIHIAVNQDTSPFDEDMWQELTVTPPAASASTQTWRRAEWYIDSASFLGCLLETGESFLHLLIGQFLAVTPM